MGDPATIEMLKTWLNAAAVVMGVSLVLAILLFALVVRQVKKRRPPPHSGFVTTLQATPFLFVLSLDLLDLALDFLAAPLAWIILSYLGLEGLRGVTVVESLIPGTQLVPTMTLCWIVSRLMPDRLRAVVQAAENGGDSRG